MVKKAIDARIPALIRNGCQQKNRSFFVVVGDRQKDVIVNLYHILLNVDIKLNKNVLWAYKKKLLGFTSHRKKREKKIRKEIKRGIRDADTDDPFELFVSTQNIRYTYYKETDKILGNTFGMCILQDFEGITPNLLARTIETVEGGGLVLLLLQGMQSLKQLYTLSMDIHSRYRTEAHSDVTARFNERFILSLGSCESCLVVDDELNVLPISGGKSVKQLPPPDTEEESPSAQKLSEIKSNLADTKPVGPLVNLAKTVDQAQALLTFVDAITEKTLQSTVALTAARGRGKSAAMGVAIAAAVAHGYSNIFITSPSPENLKTLFEFVFKGFDALEYQDHLDYSIIQSTNPDFNKAIVRVNVHRQHRQTIQYIQPQDAHVLGQAELVVIDEAAAIPLPLVKKLMGPYLVFMASTINGYEGTGRSLSLKLLSQLREQSRSGSRANGNSTTSDTSSSSRKLREITLSEPIRYAPGDPVEKWLNRVLCLDATLPQRTSTLATHGTPDPASCQLLAVNRDTLFSFHPVSEKFLNSMLSLYVASHYKNSPNDLQLMSDAPAHHLYVLVAPVANDASSLPEPLVVIQVALEGQISKDSVRHSLSRGQRPGGDLIPWLVSQQFQDDEFASLSGARVVRIATNPDYTSMGYGARALQLLIDFYAGKLHSIFEDALPDTQPEMIRVTDEKLQASTLLTDNVKVRDIHSMPPLFSRLSEIRPPADLDYIGVSYGLTKELHKFWRKARFVPLYLRQTANDLTGEHTCVMLRTLSDASDNTAHEDDWLPAFASDFHARFLSLLSYAFRAFPAPLSLELDLSATALTRSSTSTKNTDEPQTNGVNLPQPTIQLTKPELSRHFTPHDLRRLDSYANNLVDHHLITDLLPSLGHLYFRGPLRSAVKLTSFTQKALLLALGLQRRDVDSLAKELNVSPSKLLPEFNILVRKLAVHLRSVIRGDVAKDMPDVEAAGEREEVVRDGDGAQRFAPLEQGLDEELREGGKAYREAEENAEKEWKEAEEKVIKGDVEGRTFAVKREDGEKRKRKAGVDFDMALKEGERAREKRGRVQKQKKGR
ncbi:MAG: hypothetical protein Q9162_007839 [Coniocarpon cinnabarinum]